MNINYIFILLYLVFSIGGLILFKLGCQKEFIVSVNSSIFNLKISLLSILGLVSYICSFLLYMFLISKFDMTYIVPLSTALTQIITFIFAVLLFKEVITVNKVIGTIFILIGVVLISIKK